jgi:TRAP-type transport system large permease protein
MPPVGTAPFVTSCIAKVNIGQTVREMLPFYGVTLVVLMLMNYVPG